MGVTSVVNWIFSQEDAPTFGKPHIWEILRGVIHHTLQRVTHLEDEEERVAAKVSDVRRGEGERGREATSEELMEMEETSEDIRREAAAAAQERNQLFLVTFQRFSIAIANLLLKMETPSDPQIALINEYTYHVVTGNLLAIGRRNALELSPIMDTLSQNLFTEEVDERTIRIFRMFRSLTEGHFGKRKDV